MINNKSFTGKVWSRPATDSAAAARLKAALRISEPLATMLSQRGFRQPDEAHAFLYPTLHDLPSPFLLKGMREGVELIHQGLLANRPFVIYGDYDVDGVTATAVLIRFFSELGVDCRSCHPDRFKNGYGLKAELVTALLPERPGLVISVDCGISDHDEVERLVASGWQVIITDHHQPPPQLPAAHAVINPWQDGCPFPSKDLAGVGVSFYLAMGLRSYLIDKGYWQGRTPPNLKKLLDLVAVGTISDMVPLLNTNRILAKAGLEVLGRTENYGLLELLDLCHIPRGGQVNHETIAFQVGPRLNAAGRMGDARRASALLASNDRHLVRQLADIIEHENMARRELTSQLVQEAIVMVEAQGAREAPCIILHGQDWHLGLLGILSSKLVELYGRPAIVFAGRHTLKGSARSVAGVNIHEAITACAAEVLEFGGHNSAAGLSLKEERLLAFADLAQQAIRGQLHDRPAQATLHIDYVIPETGSVTDIELACALLRPFGQANPEPVFTTDKPCRLRNIQLIGKEKNHLRFSMQVAGRWLDGVGFGFSAVVDQSHQGETLLSAAFSLKENHFNGQTKPQVVLHDVLLDG